MKTVSAESHGVFQRSNPELYGVSTATVYLRNEKGDDWYTLVDRLCDIDQFGKKFHSGGLHFGIVQDGVVVRSSDNPADMWPYELEFISSRSKIEVGMGFSRNRLTEKPLILPSQVEDEMKRRLSSGISYGDKQLQTREDDRLRINTYASIARNAPEKDRLDWIDEGQAFQWITASNELIEMTPSDMISLDMMVVRRLNLLAVCARRLKDMNPIPLDYQNDAYWS